MAPVRVSGSSRSASAVDPDTSQNSTVTVLRTSVDVGAGAASRGAPQNGQNGNSSELSRPQDPHVTIRTPSLGSPGRPEKARDRCGARPASPSGYRDGVGYLDLSDEAQARAEERLGTAVVIWLTTIADDEQPQSTPVWFLWDGDSFLIYSKPGSPKV